MRALFFLVTFCLSILLSAQQQVHFNNLTEKDGLSNNRVTCFFKDKAGYLWVGTESGLNRYNGNSWKIYKPSKNKKNHLSNSFITDVDQDQHKNIWVSTRKGLNRIDAVTDTTEIFLPDPDAAKNAIPSDIIWDVFIDTDTSVWIAPDAKDFCHYNPVRKKFHYYDFKKYLPETKSQSPSPYHSILKILPGASAELWLASTDGIFSFNKETGRFRLELSINLREVRFFYFEKQQQKLYCVDEKNKLFCYRPSTRELSVTALDPTGPEKNFMAPYTMNEALLLFPASTGLAGLNGNDQTLFYIKGADAGGDDLLPGKVNCVYKDDQHITWIGTENGISKFIPGLNANLHLSFPDKLINDASAVTKNFVLLPGTEKWLIASPRDNTVFMADNKTGQISNFPMPPAYRHENCYALSLHDDDTLFLLCKGALLLYEHRSQKWAKIPFPAPFDQTAVTAMAIDASHNYWLRTIDEHLFVYNPVTRKIWVPSTEDFDNYSIYCIASDIQNNCVWIGTHSYGLYRYRLSKKEFEYVESDNKNKTSLHSYIINDIVPDGNGNIWVSTFEGGLARYKTALPPDKGFSNYDVFSGLPDDNVYGIAIGKDGDCWFTTSKGIGHMDAGGNWKGLYNQQTGLPYSNFQQGIIVLPDGKIAAITENKLICFNPAVISDTRSYPVIIDDILVNDKKVFAESRQNGSRTFTHTQNDLSFHFSVLDFTAQSAIEYYYMLEGLDKDWIYAGKQYNIRYSKLAPGSYTMRVKAKRENGSFYEPEGRFRFTIRPAFWQTWWFLTTCAAGVAFIATWLVKRRIKNIRHDAEMKHKMAEAEMAALRSQMNPHFIFNCLNAIDNLIQTNQKEKATAYLARFAKLIRNVLDSSKNNLVLFQKDHESLRLYLEMEQFRCSNRFEYTLTADNALLQGDYKVPPLLLQPFVENAIHHGLLNKESNDRVLSVKAVLIDGFIQYTVTDNGIGREKAESLKQINKPGHLSYGIAITEERLRLYNRESGPSGDVIITDLYEDGHPAGTNVQIRLKITDNT